MHGDDQLLPLSALQHLLFCERQKAVGKTSGNVLLRREQYRRTDDAGAAAAIARNMVGAKIANCRSVLMRGLRDHGHGIGADAMQTAANRLADIGRAALREASLERLRGLEGEAANVYFAVFKELVTVNRDDFAFEQRTRRPPLDRMNALLSFPYVLLAHDVNVPNHAILRDLSYGHERDKTSRFVFDKQPSLSHTLGGVCRKRICE